MTRAGYSPDAVRDEFERGGHIYGRLGRGTGEGDHL
jgi:hypothetical protein